MGDQHGARAVREAHLHEMLEECRLEAVYLAVEGPILFEERVEQEVGVRQRLALHIVGRLPRE